MKGESRSIASGTYEVGPNIFYQKTFLLHFYETSKLSKLHHAFMMFFFVTVIKATVSFSGFDFHTYLCLIPQKYRLIAFFNHVNNTKQGSAGSEFLGKPLKDH